LDLTKFARYRALALASVYSEPEDGNFHSTLIPQMARLFLPRFQLAPDATLIDIGCGQGLFLEEAARMGFTQVTGVTLSPEDAAACRAKGLRVERCDFSDLPWCADGSVDLVWCRHALEHSPYPLFSLYEFNRVCRAGGLVYVEVPAPDGARQHERNPNHHSVLGATMWTALLERAGFQLVTSDRFTLQLESNGQAIPETYLLFVAMKVAELPTPAA